MKGAPAQVFNLWKAINNYILMEELTTAKGQWRCWGTAPCHAAEPFLWSLAFGLLGSGETLGGCMDRVRSLLSMRRMLLRYGFGPGAYFSKVSIITFRAQKAVLFLLCLHSRSKFQ